MRLIAVLSVLLLAACAGRPSMDDPSLSTRELELEEFFDGRLTAYGQFQDLFGTVRRQFVAEIEGDWDGERLRLVEDFTYEDGSTEQRVWTLRKTGDETWEGTAPGVIGVAVGVFNTLPGLDPLWRLLLVTGFLGGLTTFSAFSAEVVDFLTQGRLGLALLTSAAHVLGSLLMTLAGLKTVSLAAGALNAS